MAREHKIGEGIPLSIWYLWSVCDIQTIKLAALVSDMIRYGWATVR